MPSSYFHKALKTVNDVFLKVDFVDLNASAFKEGNYINEYKILLPLVIAVFIGTNFGKQILYFVPENIFRKAFKFTLTIIAIRLICENFI